jgi:hypothetical protein
MADTYGREFVRLGLEVGEHLSDYENFIQYVTGNYDVSKVDFILITMKPVEMKEDLWYKWAEFFRDYNIYFAFLYTQQRGAPEGKESHLTIDIVNNIKKIAGSYFVGDMIGETGGLASWMEGYYEDYGIEKKYFKDMQEAKDCYIEHVASRVKIDKELQVPGVLAVEATIFSRYNFEAGVDYASAEMMCGNPEIIFASVRGASKAYGREWWASHIANEWYGGFRNDDPLKYNRLKLAYYYSYIAGARYIYPESGDIKISSYGYNYKADDPFCKAYRSIWNEFSDFIHLHSRPSCGPKVKIGFLQGNLDSYTGWGGTTVWNNFNNDDWVYGDPERGWEHLDNIYRAEKWHVPTVYGESDMTPSIPYGLYDIVPVEAPSEVLQKYDCLIFVGWNTMTNDIYDKLKSYVWDGGKLFLAVPNLISEASREKTYELINNGDFSDFLGCTVNGKGKKLNWGIKFIDESLIPGYQYPYTCNGMCDPIFSSGSIQYADVSLSGGKVIAILADKFNEWRENSPPIIVENKYGNGYTSLITSWDYPGAACMGRLFRFLVRAIIAGEQLNSDIRVIGNDKVHYAVYPDGEGYIIYLLNTDYNVSNNVSILSGKCNAEIDIESCEIMVAYVTADMILVPLDNKLSVVNISRGKNGVFADIIGNGKHTLRIFSLDNDVRDFKININGTCKLCIQEERKAGI